MKLIVAFLISATVLGQGTGPAQAEPWASMRRFLGQWTGSASGEAGQGTVTRTYERILNRRFIFEANVSRYPPQEKNKTGETHEHWGIFSYDKARKVLVLRQFHVEGFVNTYRQTRSGEGTAPLVFESENFENFDNSWRARETYEFRSNDEFVETFELAPPGKPFHVYSRNHFRRVSNPITTPAPAPTTPPGAEMHSDLLAPAVQERLTSQRRRFERQGR